MSTFSTEGYVDILGNGGILKKVYQEGAGECPSPGDEVEAHYTGTLDDGSKFDSSRDRGKVFKFTLGQGRVIRGKYDTTSKEVVRSSVCNCMMVEPPLSRLIHRTRP